MSVFSDLNVFPISNAGTLVARGNVTMNGAVKFQFTVRNGSKGRFVALPSEKSNKVDEDNKPKYFPVISLVNKEQQEELNRLVLAQLDGGKTSEKKTTVPKDGIPF
jgi:DNA-binding cell septation regulator SpoVG